MSGSERSYAREHDRDEALASPAVADDSSTQKRSPQQAAPSASALTNADAGAAAGLGVTSKMESAFGMSFGGVSLRTDEAAASRAAGMGTKAYTDGSEIGFAKGAFEPDTRAGQHVIAHEFAHVAQQRGGTPGASAGAVLGYDDGASGSNAASTDPEAAANAAADAVVDGETPVVEPQTLGSAAGYDPKPKQNKVTPPPVGTYFVFTRDGSFGYIFNTDEIRTWAIDPKQRAYQYYVSNAFGRSESEADAAAADIGGLKWETSGIDKKKLPKNEAMGVAITKDLHDKTKAYFAKKGISGSDPATGFKDTGGPVPGGPGGKPPQDGQGDSKGTSTQAPATGKDPNVDTKDVDDAKKIYEFLRKNFPDAVVFADDGVTQQDMLKFMASNPDGFKNLPAIPPDGKAIKNIDEWKAFLDKWKKAKDVGKDGTGDGNPDGVKHFHPKGAMLLEPDMPKYVKGSTVTGRVNFDRSDSDNAVMNALPERAKFDWTLTDTDNKLVSRSTSFWGQGDIAWGAELPKNGTYRLHVSVSSIYFWEMLMLVSKDIVVTDEATREKEVFDDQLVGDKATQPFTRGPDGQLQLKEGQKALTAQEEITLVDAQIGSLKALHDKGKLTDDQFSQYTKLLEDQKKSLDKMREAIGENKTYFTRGTFLSRENSATTPVKLIMSGEKPGKKPDGTSTYKVMGYDTTLDPGNATHHPGEGAGADDGKAERAAVDAMFTHIHDHNDYPDGSLHLAIQLRDGSFVEKIIDTRNWKKPAEKALGYVAMVGGVAMILAAPLTGGASVPVGILFVTTAAAGLASVALSMSEQYAKEGEIKVDGRLALNILQVVSLALGAGTMSAAFKTAGTVGKGLVLGTMLGLDVAQGVLISQSVLGQMAQIEASYDPRIAEENDPTKQAALKREKESAIAQVLGAAAVNGAFLLVSIGQGAHALKSISPSGKFYNVRPDIVELRKQYEYTRDPSDIQTYIKDKPLTFEEKAFLEDVLAHVPEGKPKGEAGDPEQTPEQKAKQDADAEAKKQAADDAAKKSAAAAEANKAPSTGKDPTGPEQGQNKGNENEPPAKPPATEQKPVDPDPAHPGVEVHNHLLGIPETKYFIDKVGGGEPRSLFDKIHELFTSSKHAKDLAVESPSTKQVVDATSQELANMDKAGKSKEEINNYLVGQLDKILAASDETPFDHSYSIRDAIIKTYIDPTPEGQAQSYKNFTADALKILHDDGINYSEQSVSAKKLMNNMSPADMAAAHKEAAAAGKDSDMRFLAMMNTKTVATEEPVRPPDNASADVKAAYERAKADYDKTMGQYKQTLEMIDKVLERGDVMGIDIAGPEEGKFTAEGVQRFLEMYEHVSKAAKARGRELVLRPHVGEGYAPPGAEQGAHVEIARANLEMLLKGLEKMGYTAAKAKADGVVIRFGHAAHATPEQIARMRDMGIIAEANIGSNLATGSIAGVDSHPLLYNLLLDEPTILSTDAHGVMGTDLTTEYARAEQMIADFKAGKTKIKVNGVDKAYADLSPGEKFDAKGADRFTVDRLKKWAAEYGDMVKSGDASEAAKKNPTDPKAPDNPEKKP